ncbi:hypothetical protein Ciccas_014128 [Cichlidogyrus casuarinus]|uniref:Uncharacterized protein n=1 Tax=Cichlidogyrus casuarinus TaxID=1844966 RepID=A0ABD2PK03_9PLAT
MIEHWNGFEDVVKLTQWPTTLTESLLHSWISAHLNSVSYVVPLWNNDTVTSDPICLQFQSYGKWELKASRLSLTTVFKPVQSKSHPEGTVLSSCFRIQNGIISFSSKRVDPISRKMICESP